MNTVEGQVFTGIRPVTMTKFKTISLPISNAMGL
jgi:hypothetical protein